MRLSTERGKLIEANLRGTEAPDPASKAVQSRVRAAFAFAQHTNAAGTETMRGA